MASKGRRRDAPPATAGVDPDVALFASYVRAEQDRERQAKRAAREERRQADQAASLMAAKDAAAAEVKRLRGAGGVNAEQRAAAESAYREALAAVVATETGETPTWAPEPVPADEPTPTATADETLDEGADHDGATDP